MRNMLYIAFQYKTDEACKPWMFSLVMLPSNVFLKLYLACASYPLFHGLAHI